MLRFRVVRPIVIGLAVLAFVAVTLTSLFLFPRTTIACEGDACVLREATILGGGSEDRIPSSHIRHAALAVSNSQRAGTSPAHGDVALVLTLADGSTRTVDDRSLFFLDPSLTRADADAVDGFVTRKSAAPVHVATGGTASAFALAVVLGALAVFLGWMWGRDEITVAVDRGDLVVDGGDERTTHPLAGATGAIVDLAHGSLRVTYADGRSVQTAKLGGCGPAKLRAIAAATTALVAAPR